MATPGYIVRLNPDTTTDTTKGICQMLALTLVVNLSNFKEAAAANNRVERGHLIRLYRMAWFLANVEGVPMLDSKRPGCLQC